MRTHSQDPANTRAPPHLELRDKWSSQEQPILPPDGCVTLGSLFSLSVCLSLLYCKMGKVVPMAQRCHGHERS